MPPQMRVDPLAWWKSEVAVVAPVGHALRPFFADNWSRFHSLPEAKRYAETEDERREVLARHSEVADAIFQVGEPIYVYRSRLHEPKIRGRLKHQLAERQLREAVVALPANPGSVAHDDDDHYAVRALVTRWRPDFFEELVVLVADEKESGVALVSPATRNTYCPYDGGMDIFSFATQRLDLETKFPDWLPKRADKL
jgi:hypothetical protein